MRCRLGEFEFKSRYFTPRCKSYDSYIATSKVNGGDYLMTKYNLAYINAPKQIVADRIIFLIDNYKMFRCESVFFQTPIPSTSIIVPENIGTKLLYFYVAEPLPIVTLSDYVLENGIDQQFLKQYFPNLLNTLSSLHSVKFPYLALSPLTVTIDEKLWLRPPPLNPYASPKSLMPPSPHAKNSKYAGFDDLRFYRAPEWKSVPPFWQTDCWALGCMLAEYLIYGHPIFMSASDTDQMLITQTILGPAPSKLNWPITKEANVADLPPILMRLLDYEPRVRPPMCLHIAIQIMMLINGEESEKSTEYSEHDLQTYTYSYSYSEIPEKESKPKVKSIQQFISAPPVFEQPQKPDVILDDKGVGSSAVEPAVHEINFHDSPNWEIDIPEIIPAKKSFVNNPIFESPPQPKKSSPESVKSKKSSPLESVKSKKSSPESAKSTPDSKPIKEKSSSSPRTPPAKEKSSSHKASPEYSKSSSPKSIPEPAKEKSSSPKSLPSDVRVKKVKVSKPEEEEEEEPKLPVTTTNISTMKLPYESPISSGIPYSYVYSSSYTPPVKGKSSAYSSPQQPQPDEASYAYTSPKISDKYSSYNTGEDKQPSSPRQSSSPKQSSSPRTYSYPRYDSYPTKSDYSEKQQDYSERVYSSYSVPVEQPVQKKQKPPPVDTTSDDQAKSIGRKHFTSPEASKSQYSSYKYSSERLTTEPRRSALKRDEQYSSSYSENEERMQRIKTFSDNKPSSEPRTFSSYTPSYMSEKDLIEPIVGSFSHHATVGHSRRSYSSGDSYIENRRIYSDSNNNNNRSYSVSVYSGNNSSSNAMMELERRVREIENSFSRSQKEIRRLAETVSSSQYSDDSFIDVQMQIRRLQGQLRDIDNEFLAGCVGCDAGNAVRKGISKLEADLRDIRSSLSSSQYS